MSFKRAVQETPDVRDSWRQGLGALRAQDRAHINPSHPRLLKGSVDVDAALRDRQPNAHRWDFAIGFRHTNRHHDCIYWVEIHPAVESEVNVIENKLRWLKNWIAQDAPLLARFECDFIWVSSGNTSLPTNAPRFKRLAELGLHHTGRTLRIPDERT